MIERLLGDRVYLDANVFIYAVENYPKYATLALQVLQAIENRQMQAVTSDLTIAEVLIAPVRRNNQELVRTFMAVLQAKPHFEMIPVSRNILVASAELRAINGGKLPDAIHGPTALKAQCRLLLTADRTFRAPQGLELVLLDELLLNGNG